MNTKDSLLIEAYVALAHPLNQYQSRHTGEGQKLLCDLRQAVAEITGLTEEEVQDFKFKKEQA